MTPIPPTMPAIVPDPLTRLLGFVEMGGPAMWAISALSVATMTLILWKIWHLIRLGAFSGRRVAGRALALWEAGEGPGALALLQPSRGIRAQVLAAAMTALQEARLDPATAEAAVELRARALLAQARAGLRGLELAASVGPLLGLLGTVTGMILAFQGLQAAGVKADTATLAGGIWEALLTTAAGMSVAIPAMAALSWFDGVIEALRHDIEDGAGRVFLCRPAAVAAPAAAGRARLVPAAE